MAIRMLLLLFVLSGGIIHAGPCLSGPLFGYLGGSCTLAGVVFDNWSYAPGATGVPATSINVTPSAAGPVFEFLEVGPGWLQAAGATTSGSIGFRGTGSNVGTRLYLGFGGPTGATGGVTLVSAICLNSVLAGCAGGTLKPSISSFNMGGAPPVILSESFYPLAASADILTTFTITGGSAGAGLSVFESGLYAVPEPRTTMCLALGLAVIVAVRRRRLSL